MARRSCEAEDEGVKEVEDGAVRKGGTGVRVVNKWELGGRTKGNGIGTH